MKRGRPPQSQIRQNIIEILFFLNSAHGYQISKLYSELFPKVTQRSIYYHLRKGLALKEFQIDRIEKETGDFSWGSTAEKIYYKLGKKAKPQGHERVKAYLAKKIPPKDISPPPQKDLPSS